MNALADTRASCQGVLKKFKIDKEEDWLSCFKVGRDEDGNPKYGPMEPSFLDIEDEMEKALAMVAYFNPFINKIVFKKLIDLLGSLSVQLKNIDWGNEGYEMYKKIKGGGAWHAKFKKIRKQTKTNQRMSLIREPLMRVMHRLVVRALIHKLGSKERCQKRDMWMMNALEESHGINLAWVIVEHLCKHAPWLKENSLICRGHYVTKIPKSLGYLVNKEVEKCSESIECEKWTSKMLANELDLENFTLLRPTLSPPPTRVAREQRQEPHSLGYEVGGSSTTMQEDDDDATMSEQRVHMDDDMGISCIDDLDFFKDLKNEFPAIVYNDALTSKSDFSTEPTLCPQHIDEFDLKDKTSLSEYDKVEQNVLYFNDLFPFNIIYLEDLKSDKDNDKEIDMIQSSGDMAPLPPREQRHPILRMRMEHRNGDRVMVFTSQTWSRVFETRGLLVRELILEFLSTLRFGEREFILAMGLHTREEMKSPSFASHCRPPLSYTLIRDLVLRLFQRMMAHSIAGMSQALEKVTVTDLFYLRVLNVESVNILYLISKEIYVKFRDTWGWVPAGPTRQEGDVGGVAEEALVAPGDGDEDEEIPQVVPLPPKNQGERIARFKEEVHGMREILQGQREVLDSMARDFLKFTTWTITSLAWMMDRAGVTYTRYSKSSVEKKTGSKFSIIVHEYGTKPSTLSKSRAELRRKSVYKSVKAEEKSNLKTS
nr:hypothetical protein [Tanacetum cinerariifolium]